MTGAPSGWFRIGYWIFDRSVTVWESRVSGPCAAQAEKERTQKEQTQKEINTKRGGSLAGKAAGAHHAVQSLNKGHVGIDGR